MANPEPIPVTATHHLHQRTTNIPAGTPGEITAMTDTSPVYYTVSFRLNGGKQVIMDHLTRLDLHEA